MARLKDDEYVKIDGKKVRDAIAKTGLSLDRISTVVLNRDQSYISKATNRNAIGIAELKKLCEFLALDYDSLVIQKEEPVTANQTKETNLSQASLETIIVGTNLMYENQKKMIEVMEQMLIEIKALNAKQNRLENALGQIVQNTVVLKENTTKSIEKANDLKSTVNIISGRVKDLTQTFQKVGKDA